VVLLILKRLSLALREELNPIGTSSLATHSTILWNGKPVGGRPASAKELLGRTSVAVDSS
jgi:hypothetical protein